MSYTNVRYLHQRAYWCISAAVGQALAPFKNDRTPLAKSPDWLKAAPMWENLRASWRQSGQKQDHCPSLLNHNAKYKRLLPPCCDFANGVGSFSVSHNRMVSLPVRLEPLLPFTCG